MMKTRYPNCCNFIGCIGDDPTGVVLEDIIRKEGVVPHLEKNKDYPTG
jgi:sugar/nucleoside kinase (ribokinase family)